MKLNLWKIITKIKNIESAFELFLQLYRYLETMYKTDDKIKVYLISIKEKLLTIFDKDVTKE
jgi:hypothetical protein